MRKVDALHICCVAIVTDIQSGLLKEEDCDGRVRNLIISYLNTTGRSLEDLLVKMDPEKLQSLLLQIKERHSKKEAIAG